MKSVTHRCIHQFMLLVVMAFPALTSAKSVPAFGTWIDCNFAPLLVSLPGTTTDVVTVGITQDFSGTLDGTYTGSERDVLNADGSATFRGGGIFTGTVAGRSGTASFRYEWIAPAGADGYATWVLEGLTGSLDGVQGQGTFAGSSADFSDACPAGKFSGTYEGTVEAR